VVEYPAEEAMGRVEKPFVVANLNKRYCTNGRALIDTGADVSMISHRMLRPLHIKLKEASTHAAATAGGEFLVGYRFPVQLEVEGVSAPVKMFLPTHTISEEEIYKPVPKKKKHICRTSLIGTDFLQLTGTSLDFSSPHELVFKPGSSVNFIQEVKVPPAVHRFLMEQAKYVFGPKKKSGASVKKLARQVHSLLKKK
jgi:hypothetical protein